MAPTPSSRPRTQASLARHHHQWPPCAHALARNQKATRDQRKSEASIPAAARRANPTSSPSQTPVQPLRAPPLLPSPLATPRPSEGLRVRTQARAQQEQPAALAAPRRPPAKAADLQQACACTQGRGGAPTHQAPRAPPAACSAAGGTIAAAATCAGSTTSYRGESSGPTRRMKGCATPTRSEPAHARLPRWR